MEAAGLFTVMPEAPTEAGFDGVGHVSFIEPVFFALFTEVCKIIPHSQTGIYISFVETALKVAA